MISAAERKAIGEHFEAGWLNRAPVAWPNAKFDIPDTEWVRFSIIDGDARQMEIGGIKNMDRVIGLVYVSVFYPRDGGDYKALQLADAAVAILQKRRIPITTIGSVLFRNGLVRPGAADGKHSQHIVSIPFQTDYVL